MRRWLSAYAVSITSIVIVAFLVPLAVLVRDLATDRAMNAAEREAQTIARFAATVADDASSLSSLRSTLETAPDGSVVLSDLTVLGAPLPAGIDLSAARDEGQAYRQSLDASEAVVVPVIRAAAAPWVVVVTVPDDARDAGVAQAWLVLGGLGLALVALAFVVADRMGRAVVEPIDELVEATKRLGRGELTVNVDPGGPSELAEVGRAFNNLTDRVSVLMDRERETAADLSHRLRTPMTALKLNVESLGAEVDVSRIQADIDQIERVVGHIIREARRSVKEESSPFSDLATVTQDRVEFWGTLASDQEREWSLSIESGTYGVRCSMADLEAMLDAVLGNVFAHTETGVSWGVNLRRDGDDCLLSISDAGTGIADPGLLERGESGAASTGLGVDIVRRTASSAGGSASWDNSADGTVVTIRLPAKAS